jgi:hypothetical protein
MHRNRLYRPQAGRLLRPPPSTATPTAAPIPRQRETERLPRTLRSRQLGIGPHVEEIALAGTNLGQQNPIILGFPRLAHHNPHIVWPSRTTHFGSRGCRDHCQAIGIAIEDCTVPSIPASATPVAPAPPTRELAWKVASSSKYRSPSVEDAEDEGEGYFSGPDAPELPAHSGHGRPARMAPRTMQ